MQSAPRFPTHSLFRLMILIAGFSVAMSSAHAGFLAGSLAGTTAASASEASSDSTSSPFESSSDSSSDDSESEKTARQFIHQNYDPLQSDIARGQGQHLQALMSIYQCAQTEQNSLIQAIRLDVSDQMQAKDHAALNLETRAGKLHDIVGQQVKGQFAQACVV